MDAIFAIDVAVLPPEPVARCAIAISAALPSAGSKGLRLDATHLPHITLTQQFVAVHELPEIEQAIGRVVAGRLPLPLTVTGAAGGTSSVWMQIGHTPALDDLHAALMDALHPFERPAGDATAFAGGDARLEDIKWVSGFRRKAGYKRYQPHITLGHARTRPPVDTMIFDAETIALCHLGRFCTCREVLHAWGR